MNRQRPSTIQILRIIKNQEKANNIPGLSLCAYQKRQLVSYVNQQNFFERSEVRLNLMDKLNQMEGFEPLRKKIARFSTVTFSKIQKAEEP